MTVRVERTVELDAPPDRVWSFLASPDDRAAHISVIEDWTVHDDGSATWHVSLPLPFVDRTVAIETRDTERRAPEYVSFTGRSRVLNVTGEHELEPTDDGTRLTNRFVVDGRLPGVERFFERNLDAELRNLERGLRESIEAEPAE